jgi:glycogen synthase
MTIHNLLYRGEGSGRALAEYGVPVTEIARALPDWLRDSPLGLALLSADMLSTVSPTYSREILARFGEGLDVACAQEDNRGELHRHGSVEPRHRRDAGAA